MKKKKGEREGKIGRKNRPHHTLSVIGTKKKNWGIYRKKCVINKNVNVLYY